MELIKDELESKHVYKLFKFIFRIIMQEIQLGNNLNFDKSHFINLRATSCFFKKYIPIEMILCFNHTIPRVDFDQFVGKDLARFFDPELKVSKRNEFGYEYQHNMTQFVPFSDSVSRSSLHPVDTYLKIFYQDDQFWGKNKKSIRKKSLKEEFNNETFQIKFKNDIPEHSNLTDWIESIFKNTKTNILLVQCRIEPSSLGIKTEKQDFFLKIHKNLDSNQLFDSEYIYSKFLLKTIDQENIKSLKEEDAHISKCIDLSNLNFVQKTKYVDSEFLSSEEDEIKDFESDSESINREIPLKKSIGCVGIKPTNFQSNFGIKTLSKRKETDEKEIKQYKKIKTSLATTIFISKKNSKDEKKGVNLPVSKLNEFSEHLKKRKIYTNSQLPNFLGFNNHLFLFEDTETKKIIGFDQKIEFEDSSNRKIHVNKIFHTNMKISDTILKEFSTIQYFKLGNKTLSKIMAFRFCIASLLLKFIPIWRFTFYCNLFKESISCCLYYDDAMIKNLEFVIIDKKLSKIFIHFSSFRILNLKQFGRKLEFNVSKLKINSITKNIYFEGISIYKSEKESRDKGINILKDVLKPENYGFIYSISTDPKNEYKVAESIDMFIPPKDSFIFQREIILSVPFENDISLWLVSSNNNGYIQKSVSDRNMTFNINELFSCNSTNYQNYMICKLMYYVTFINPSKKNIVKIWQDNSKTKSKNSIPDCFAYKNIGFPTKKSNETDDKLSKVTYELFLKRYLLNQ